MPLEWILSYVTKSDDGCGITNQNHCSSHLGIEANENKPCIFMKCNTMILHNLKSWMFSMISNNNSQQRALFETLWTSSQKLKGDKSTWMIEDKISRPEHELDLHWDTSIHCSYVLILMPFSILANLKKRRHPFPWQILSFIIFFI